MKKVGILYDNISGNMGDQAIGISVRKMLAEMGADYEELVPGRFNPNDYSTIIVGGGHLVRPAPDFFYDKFRVRGRHILNCCGVVGSPLDLDYLNEYLYVTVRSNGDSNKLAYLDREVSVVPCTTMLLKDLPASDLRIRKPSVGVHLWQGTGDDRALVEYLEKLPLHTYFLPITHYNRDFGYLERLSQRVANSTLLPIMRPEEIFTVIGAFNYFISMSLHGAIFAYVHNVPFVLYTGEDKREFFMTDRGLDKHLFSNLDELPAKFDDLQNNRPDYSAALDKDLRVLQEHKLAMRDMLPKQAATAGAGPSTARHGSQAQEQQAVLQERDFQVHYLQSQVGVMAARARQQVARISSLETSLQEKFAEIHSLESHVHSLESHVHSLESHAHSLEHQIHQVERSIPMQLVRRYQMIVDRLLRPGTRRRRPYDLALMGTRVILNEGWRSFWLRYKRYRAGGKPVPTRLSARDLAVIMAPPEETISPIETHVVVVIPTKNAGPDFEFTLERIANAEGVGTIETIVVDSGSKDGTIGLAEKYGARVVKIRPDEFNHGLTRNFGAAHASGDYVLFMVQDAIPVGDRWLYDMVRPMETDSTISATTCRQVARSDADLFACFSLWTHYRVLWSGEDVVRSAPPDFGKLPPLERRRLAGLDNVCCLVRRRVFEDLKFRDMSYAEDLDLGLRLLEQGHRVAFRQSIAVVHSHNRTASYFMKRSYVETRLLPRILPSEQEHMSAPRDFRTTLGGLMMLYAALNATVRSPLPYGEPVERLCAALTSELQKKLARGPRALAEFPEAGGNLDAVLERLHELAGETPMVLADSLIRDYLARFDVFSAYLSVYPTLEDKQAEFVESLYKLYAAVAGAALATHTPGRSEGDTVGERLPAIDAFLSEGV